MLAEVRKDVSARELPVTPNDWAQSITDDMLRAFQNGEPDAARDMLVEALERRAEVNNRS